MIIILGMAWVLTGCAGRDDDHEYDLLDQVAYWQIREKMVTDLPYRADGVIDLGLAKEISMNVFHEIDLDYRKTSYVYPTSREVLSAGSAVCIGYAVLIYSELRAAGFPDDALYIAMSLDHAVACVEYGWDIYCFDRTRFETRLDDLIDFQPILFFNLFGAWMP